MSGWRLGNALAFALTWGEVEREAPPWGLLPRVVHRVGHDKDSACSVCGLRRDAERTRAKARARATRASEPAGARSADAGSACLAEGRHGFMRMRALAAALRAAWALALLLVPAWAGCAQPPPPPEEPEVLLLALDGRWPFDPQRAQALIARAEAPAPEGSLVLGEAMGARVVGDFAGLDTRAGATLGTAVPARGEAFVSRAWAQREGARIGETLALRSHASEAPYVASYFEMERTPPCERRADAKLCFLPVIEQGVARLRLRVDPGARDAAFLPDLVELGPGARPAWWNGTFEGPNGERKPFTAYAPLEANLTFAEIPGEMAAGDWIVSFRLDTRLGVAAAGSAGIVRVREPGYLWFDDRLQQHADGAAQARAIIANMTPTRASVRVADVADALPLGADIILDIEDARALAGTNGVSALLVNWTPSALGLLDAARSQSPDGVSLALRARAPPANATRAVPAGDPTFAAPADLDLASLPPIEGALAPALALAGRAPVGESPTIDAAVVDAPLLLLAHADGRVPWTLPPGARWEQAPDALENLSRSRTLALASEDLLLAPIATARVEIGSGNTTRTLVAIGGVEGGPSKALWTSAALVAGSGRPVSPRIVLPVEEGADREAVIARALDAWSKHGVVLDR